MKQFAKHVLFFFIISMLSIGMFAPILDNNININHMKQKETTLPDTGTWWDSDWSYYQTITIDSDYIDENLTNFPILVAIASDISDDCDDGDSIRFLSTDNSTEFYYEIEHDIWDNSSTNHVWVNISETITSDSDYEFLMYYGNSDASDNQSPSDVWDTNYVLVHHLNGSDWDDCDDSTSNNNDVFMDSGSPSYNIAGQVGYGVEWVNDGDRLLIEDAASLNITENMTLEAWATTDVTEANFIFAKRNDGVDDSYGILTNTSKALMFELWIGNVRKHADSTNILGSYWTYCVGRYNKTYMTTFVNGSEDYDYRPAETGVIDTIADHLMLGWGYDSSYTWDGYIDEVRISNIARNSSWINATYNTIEQSDFLTWEASASLIINVYDENTSDAISGWDVFISNSDATQTYESLNNNNPVVIITSDIPFGTNSMIHINATNYDSRIYYMDLVATESTTLDAYLSQSNDTNLYVIYVVNEFDDAVEDATVHIKKYINDSEGYQSVSTLLTDANGRINIHLIPNELYLLEISKTGYETEISTLIPDPDYHGPYYPTTFRLLFSREEPDLITPTDGITFNATINTSGVIQVWYDDFYSATIDTSINIYEYHDATLIWNHTDDRTNQNTFTFTNTSYNTSRTHKLILYVNRTDYGFAKMSFFLYPLRTTTDESTIEDYFDNVFGDFELGWVKTFFLFVPCMIFLIAFGASHAGLGILVSGLYLGFSTLYLTISDVVTIAGESMFIMLAAMLIIVGFLVIVIKKGRSVI